MCGVRNARCNTFLGPVTFNLLIRISFFSKYESFVVINCSCELFVAVYILAKHTNVIHEFPHKTFVSLIYSPSYVISLLLVSLKKNTNNTRKKIINDGSFLNSKFQRLPFEEALLKRHIAGDDAQAQMHKDNYLSINTIQNTLKRVLFLFRFGSLAGVANLCRERNTDEW